MLSLRGYRLFNQPEICSGDQSRISLLATIVRSLLCLASRQAFGRTAPATSGEAHRFSVLFCSPSPNVRQKPPKCRIPFLSEKAWEANIGLGIDEQAGFAADRSVDRGAGWPSHDGVGSRGAGRERTTDATLLTRYREGGGGALIHWARGRPRSTSLSAGVREYAVELVRQNYLTSVRPSRQRCCSSGHGIKVSRETLRKWMVEEGLWLSRKQRRSFHQPRLAP